MHVMCVYAHVCIKGETGISHTVPFFCKRNKAKPQMRACGSSHFIDRSSTHGQWYVIQWRKLCLVSSLSGLLLDGSIRRGRRGR